MARSYSSAVTALTVGVDQKWIDNLLSRHAVPGVTRARQGVPRRVAESGLVAVELCRILNLELGVSLQQSVLIAAGLLEARTNETRYTTTSGLTLLIALDDLAKRLLARVPDAVETLGEIRRGRPATRPTP